MGAVLDGSELPDVNLHAPSHWLRYVIIAGAAVILGGAFWALESSLNKKDAAQLAHFDRFRAAYADQCGVPDFVKPQPELMNNTYLTSPAIQAAMDKELVALQNGASCEEIARALKAVDFVVPKPPPEVM